MASEGRFLHCPRCGYHGAIEIDFGWHGWDADCECCGFGDSFVDRPWDSPYGMARYSWKGGNSKDQAKLLSVSELETALSSLRRWIRRGRILPGTVYLERAKEATRQLDFLIDERHSVPSSDRKHPATAK